MHRLTAETGRAEASWLRLVLTVLAVWRITHLLAREDGPWAVVARLREGLGDTVAGRLLDCFKCLSLWVAVPFAWMVGAGPPRVLAWLALSGGAVLLEESLEEPLVIETEVDDELLR